MVPKNGEERNNKHRHNKIDNIIISLQKPIKWVSKYLGTRKDSEFQTKSFFDNLIIIIVIIKNISEQSLKVWWIQKETKHNHVFTHVQKSENIVIEKAERKEESEGGGVQWNAVFLVEYIAVVLKGYVEKGEVAQQLWLSANNKFKPVKKQTNKKGKKKLWTLNTRGGAFRPCSYKMRGYWQLAATEDGESLFVENIAVSKLPLLQQ